MEAVQRREVVLGEEQLLARRPLLDYSGGVTSEVTSADEIISDEGKKLTAEIDALDISKLVNAVINSHQNDVAGGLKDDGALSISSVIVEEENVTATIIEAVEESDEEEEIEMEFERAADKTHTHTPYCPNCKNRITKVILRRKKRSKPPVDHDLLGCFSCFTIFKPSGNCLNPFGFFKSKPKLESTRVEDVQPSIYNDAAAAVEIIPKVEGQLPMPSTDVESTTSNAAAWSVCNLFPTFGKRESDQNQKEETGKLEIRKGEEEAIIDIEAVTEGCGSGTINIHERGELQQPLISGSERSKSFEILKCIVYGGLIESITSLSIVSSAVASDVTTLRVVAIGLATLFSGLIIFGCNLLELRNEASTPKEKYEKALGRKGHFVFHSTFAIFSYLVFGLIAPITYGFAFRESDDKDYKIIAVAAASIAAIFLLSIAKAYVTETKNLGGYVKSVVCYVTMAFAASGLAYAAGDLFGILLDNLAWFQKSPQGVKPSLLSY